EKIKKLTKIFDFSALLILPDVSVSTKKVYANYRHDVSVYEQLSARINNYVREKRFDLVLEMCANMLRTSSFSLYRELAELKASIESFGIGPLCLSGSGSALFLVVDRKEEKRARKDKCKLDERIGCTSIIVSNNRW
ncbi:MAG: hypothetical protein ACYSU4_21250, partial [Planctomycetota bacterium]